MSYSAKKWAANQSEGKVFLTVKDYISELDDKMKEVEGHISRCNKTLTLNEVNFSDKELQLVRDNLKISITRKNQLHDEIVGMVDYEDEYGSDCMIQSFGWKRFLPEHLKGDGYCYDRCASEEALSYTAATNKDFEFW